MKTSRVVWISLASVVAAGFVFKQLGKNPPPGLR